MTDGPSTATPVEREDPTPAATPVRRSRRWRGGLEAASASAAGHVHPTNEDCCIHAPGADAPVFCAVADGVGGGAYGEVASHTLIAHCAAAGREIYRNPDRLVEYLQQADTVVREALARRSDRPGASTLVAAWFLSAGRMHLINIGDCRAYRLRPRLWGGCRIEQLTVDQTYHNLGLPTPARGRANDPARMAGVGAVGTPPVLRRNLREGELLLLCSDGLHKFVANAELAALVGEALRNGTGLEPICRLLVRAAQRNGSHDDVSAVLVYRHPWLGAAAGYWLALLAVLLAGASSLL